MVRRTRKTSLAQKVVDTATLGMPRPVQQVVGTRWGARIALGAAAALFVSGVVTVQWTGYAPHLQFNQERAAEVKEEVREAVVEQAQKLGVEKADRSDSSGFLRQQAN
ncbi:MAG TPA: hypothetical protein VMF30_17390 [Pirellulales bacterium]|nr:hypothetical protein [Pirellulales bacterium]